MNFEEFKKRYVEKLRSAGFVVDDENDMEFNDRMAEIYLGLMVYANFQNEMVEKAIKEQQEKQRKPRIITPHRGINQ